MSNDIKTNIVLNNNSVSSSTITSDREIKSSVKKENTDRIYTNVIVVDNNLSVDLSGDNDLLFTDMSDQSEKLGGQLTYYNAGGIGDVRENGQSVVRQNVAYVTVPTKVSDLPNDCKYTVDSETGNYLRITEQNNLITIRLYSVVGYELNSVSFYRSVYHPGVCVDINSKNEINLLFDKSVLKMNERGELTIDTNVIATKEDLKLKQDKLTVINGLELNNQTNTLKTLFNIEDQKVEF